MKILDQYNRSFNTKEIQTAVEQALKDANDLYTKEYLKLAFSCIDLTSLNIDDTFSKIEKLTFQVSNFNKNFSDIPNVAAICIYPNFIGTVKKNLTDPNVKIASVTGGFPSSQTFLEIKTQETRLCIQRGADEVDMVISLGEFLNGDYAYIHHEIKKIRKAAGDAHLKVILETGLIQDPLLIYRASIIAMNAGADFIKTSTGKEKIGATLEAAYVMAMAIKDYYEDTKEKVGLKPSGGIADPHQAIAYLALVKNVLGQEWLNPKLFRFGASRLANNLLSAILDEDINYF